jgi:manganese efflux pump family protein
LTSDLATILKLGVLVLSLGLDTLTVAVGLGMSGVGHSDRLRVGASFALFEGGMPLVGFVIGRGAGGVLGDAASLMGIVVLFGVGAWMVYEAIAGDEKAHVDVEDWRGLVLTSISVSLDELAIGFGMGALGLPILVTVILIAAHAFVLTLVGTAVGNRIGERLAERAELAAGLVLCGLAVVLLGEKVIGAR